MKLATRLTLVAAAALVACEGLFGPADEEFVELIAFTAQPANSADPQASEIFTMRPDGSQVRQRTTGLKAAHPAWSPDGKSIAFASGLPTLSVIYVMDASGANLRQLTDLGSGTHPTWSPDGTELAYERGDTIFRAPIAGGTPTVLLACEHPCGLPAWSPDGTRMAFIEYRPNGTPVLKPRLSVFSVADPNPAAVSTGLVYEDSPRWTPEGAQIVFIGSPDGNTFDVYTATPGGAEATVLLDLKAPLSAPSSAAVSEAGDRILFAARLATVGPNYEQGIYLQLAAGGDPVRLLKIIPGPYDGTGPTWRPMPTGN